MCRATKKAMQLHGRAGISLRTLPTVLRHFYPRLQKDDRTVCAYAAVVAYRDARAPWAVQQYVPPELRPARSYKPAVAGPVEGPSSTPSLLGRQSPHPVAMDLHSEPETPKNIPWRLVTIDSPAAQPPRRSPLSDDPRQRKKTGAAPKRQEPERVSIIPPPKIMPDLANVTDTSSSTDTESEKEAPRPPVTTVRQSPGGRHTSSTHRRRESPEHRRKDPHRRRATASESVWALKRRISYLQRQLDGSHRRWPSHHEQCSYGHGSTSSRSTRGRYQRR